MRKSIAFLLSVSVGAMCLGSPALAQYGMDRNGPKNAMTPDLPHCDRPLGRAAVQEPESRWWEGLGLSNPESLLKLFALKSGCLRIVDRNGGLAMRNMESGLNSSGDLQRGSNIGHGQIAAADYFIIPDIADSNNNSGGSNIGAAAGSFLGHGFGSVLGGLSIKKSEAHTLITLVDARTTEQLYIAEGAAQKSDMSFGAGGGFGGWGGFGALGGGGYSNTDIGKVIAAAYFNAFVDLVHYMQGQQPGQASANAPAAAQHVTTTVRARATPSATGRVAYTLQAGTQIYPTGQRSGVWMEVDDENGNRGWIPSTLATGR